MGPPWRARQGDGRRGVAWLDSGSSPSRAREEGDGLDRWGLPVGGREERGRELGRGEGIGPAGLGCAGRKGKKKMGWAENGLEGREKFLLFFSF